MKLIFVGSITRPASLAVSILTASAWSHVAMVSPRGDRIIDAIGKGVCERSRDSLEAAFTKRLEVTIPLPDEAAAWSFAKDQVGKPYDWSALYAFALPGRFWNEPDAWFCSELAAATLVRGGWRPSGEWHEVSRVTPAMLRDATRPQ